jgi:hypothetical protein
MGSITRSSQNWFHSLTAVWGRANHAAGSRAHQRHDAGRRRGMPPGRSVTAPLLLLLAATWAMCVSTAAAVAAVAPVPHVHPVSKVIRYKGRGSLLVESVEILGVVGYTARASCDGCPRYNTRLRTTYPGRGDTLFRGLNWIVSLRGVVSVRVFRAHAVGRFVNLVANLGRRPGLIPSTSGCLASFVLVTPCPPTSIKLPAVKKPPDMKPPVIQQSPISYTLTLSATGSGTGAVTGSGISCPGSCSQSYPAGTTVTLSPTPALGSTFSSWSGACTGSGSCTLTMDAAKSITATFTAVPAAATHAETVGGDSQTWTNYLNGGGTQGMTIPGGTTVQISCTVMGLPVDQTAAVPNGDTWWYRIASAPWSNQFYASADGFYNNGATTGSLVGTPLVDPNVPAC